jgi:tetratricopeptide (TPR) repeat protein
VLLRAGYEALDAMGEKAILSTVAAVLARVLLEQDRDREAEKFTELADELAASGDLLTHMVWRGVRARILAKRGQIVDAETFAREAVAIAEQTDFLNDRAVALLDLGEVLATAERVDEARSTVAEAVALYEQKGNVVSTRAVRLRLPKHTAV